MRVHMIPRCFSLLAVSLLCFCFVCAHSRRALLLKATDNDGLNSDLSTQTDEGVSTSSIAYLLFASAQPLAEADGSSSSLLPFLRPIVLQQFEARCNPTLAMDLDHLVRRISGARALQACQYDLYKSLQATFAWVRDNVALRLQEVDSQPDAAFALPDLSVLPKLELAAAVHGALADDTKLGNIAATVERSCGLSSTDFAAFVLDVSSVLTGLHAELALLQSITRDLITSNNPRAPAPLHIRYSSDDELKPAGAGDDDVGDGGNISKGAAIISSRTRNGNVREEERIVHVDGIHITDDSAATGSVGVRTNEKDDIGVAGGASNSLSSWLESSNSISIGLRTSASAEATSAAAVGRITNFVYDMPPKSDYVYVQPSRTPRILLPIIFHVFSYRVKNSKDIGPAYLLRAPWYADRLVRVANLMTKPTNVQFFVKEVRTDVTKFPYLRAKSYNAWINSPNVFSKCAYNDTEACMASFNGYPFSSMVGDFGRSINVFISSSTATSGLVGYAYMPLSDINPAAGYVWLSWDTLLAEDEPAGGGRGLNNRRSFEFGANGLAHEIFHGLGVNHPFKNNCTSGGDYDDILDTPVVSLIDNDYAGYSASATSFCVKKFWEELRGDWDLISKRWDKLGIPDEDKNVWLDTCPDKPGYDDIGNWMTYASEICQAVLGHFTPGQVQLAHFKTSELNPIMYSWGQYYAQKAAPPPPAQISPPSPPSLPSSVGYSNYSICMTTLSNCRCKRQWSMKGKLYSGCSQIDGKAPYPGALYCEVANTTSCTSCSGRASQCIQQCIGNYTQCALPASPPPPFPPSPPPMPPPPPPRGMPDACKRAANGCECKRTWEDIFGKDQTFWSYCAPGETPAKNGRLLCQVTPSCPTFSPETAFVKCSRELTAEFCGGGKPVIFSTSRLPSPPAPASPPPPKRPRRPRANAL